MATSPAALLTTPGGAEPGGSVPLPILQAGGFSATADAYAWEPDPDPSARRMHLWFVSLLGSHEAVKALWARLVKGDRDHGPGARGHGPLLCART